MELSTTSLHPKRIRKSNNQPINTGPVIYWMSREQRVSDNWGLLLAQDIAKAQKTPLIVLFSLTTTFLGATLRQYDFMLTGLEEVEKKLQQKNIPFILLTGSPEKTITEYAHTHKAAAVVTDFSPLRIFQDWHKKIAQKSNCAVLQVDGHNVVPAWVLSNKQEYAARTIRPKIHAHLKEYLTDFPRLKKMEPPKEKYPQVNWKKVRSQLRINTSVTPITWLQPGESAAATQLNTFLKTKIKKYAILRNDPSTQYLSNMSPYLHFGHISPQRVALETQAYDTYFEEVVVRRELAENFCFYNKNYDSTEGFPEWANISLKKHESDTRKYLYSLEEFETAQTHDPAWNAAQNEMLKRGKMHGYMRMYWAKKILEWTPNAQKAMEIAIYLNDTYQLDGRDPNGYTGIAWSIGGVHDRGWTEREIFGKIRYMNYAGLKRKYPIQDYISAFTL